MCRSITSLSPLVNKRGLLFSQQELQPAMNKVDLFHFFFLSVTKNANDESKIEDNENEKTEDSDSSPTVFYFLSKSSFLSNFITNFNPIINEMTVFSFILLADRY